MDADLDTDLDTEIRRAEGRLRDAMRTGDVAELDALIDDRLVFIGPDGGVYHKEDDLELHRSGAERLTRVDVEDIRIERHGPAAVAVVVAHLAGVFQGVAFEGRYRYLRTWVRGDQGWKIVAGSVCSVPLPLPAE